MKTTEISSNGLTAAQQALTDLWDEHVRNEFAAKDADAALATMTPDAYVNHVPVLTGGVGKEELRDFYANHFIPKMPADTEIVPISRTIGSERVVDEMIMRFTHTIEIPDGARCGLSLLNAMTCCRPAAVNCPKTEVSPAARPSPFCATIGTVLPRRSANSPRSD